MRSANQALASGEPERAAELFEQAARVNDSTPEAEIGMVRAHLQAGEYRKALAFATLVAGEHRRSPEAEAFLAWVEFIGGQKDFAIKRLDTALVAAPDNVELREVRARIRALAGEAGYRKSTESAITLDPYPTLRAGAPDANALIAQATGVLVAGGTSVLTVAAALASSKGDVWIRNGLGQIRWAQVERVDENAGYALLKLAEPMPTSASIDADQIARAFPGSPCYVVQIPTMGNRFIWPVLTLGFLGREGTRPNRVNLATQLPKGANGGAVFDGAGRLVGLVLAPAAEIPNDSTKANVTGQVLLIDPLRELLADAFAAAHPSSLRPAGARPRIPLEGVYERALPAVVTVLTTR